ncbi:alpha-ketoglutarate-dependent dioxygenase AlkB [Spirillospora sp. NBC_01491]|uniref:alpha-ketoglutarate-dependent dioxygenase AlkB n=1 Tax=Spirillospora sp. NBC_01491 TaxID=2976007 RepID=UPI002E313661|nr:alpha-ketoglutarate-dependent dioxygenase AlkB [Spirillospora sp. NBC_01491]
MPPGLHLVNDWLSPADAQVLAERIDAADWSDQLKRRVQHYGHRYDYGRRGVAAGAPAPPLPGWASDLGGRLHAEGHLGEPPDQVIVNEYRPGQGISAHVDCVPCFGPVVAAVSLLSGCVMEFSEKDGEGREARRLEPRSLCVMTGPSRFAWRHAIPARKTDPGPDGAPARVARGRRISVTLRTVLKT